MKIFISGPISGMPDHNRMAFICAENRLWLQGHAVMNPVRLQPSNPDAFTHEDYVHICLAMLQRCDAIYLLKGWQWSTGACAEYGAALKTGKWIFFEEASHESI